MVSLENVTYTIKGNTLVNDVSVHFEKGQIHLILGPNGAGKSTLIKLISSELKPTRGTILLEDVSLLQTTYKEQAQFRAVLSQSLELSFPLKVHEVILMGRYPHFADKPTEHDLDICEKSMELFDLHKLKNRNYLTLSGGEKQRVQFARIFAQIWEPIEGKSRLLLLDEPLTYLDIFYQYDLMKKIEDFRAANDDLTVIGVVHDMNIAAKFAHKILLLKDSSVFGYGAVEEMLTEEKIYDVFKVKVENYFKL
jgi:iron complex transport system ATP-binding protein